MRLTVLICFPTSFGYNEGQIKSRSEMEIIPLRS